MDWRLKLLGIFLVPLLASCASVAGLEKKEPAPSRGDAGIPLKNLESLDTAKAETSKIFAEFCSLACAGIPGRNLSSNKDKLAGLDQGKVSRNPLVPDLAFPVPSGALSSPFGYRRGVFHSGLDITASRGDPIVACSDGRVVFTGSRKGYRSYGQTVLLDHGGDVYTHYAHLSKILVRPGGKVRKGDKIALVGSTGRSTSPHLHLEVRVGNKTLNPYAYFAPDELAGIKIAKTFSTTPMGPVSSRRRAGAFFSRP
jgi:murein DD-endopeptidase MepM/ murein hydrolase activator NlpD